MITDKIVKPLLASIVSTLIFFAFFEVAMRVYTHYVIFYDVEMTRYAMELKQESPNPKIGHVHQPNRSLTLMGVPVETNDDGLRDRNYPVERTEGTHRIAILGDSLTFGWGVEKEDSYEYLLEEQLNEIRPVELINFAAGNYNTEQQVNVFFEKGLKYEPDKVVVFFFINDAEPTPQKSGWEFLGNLRSVTFFWSKVLAVRGRFVPTESFKEFYANLYLDQRPGWQNFQVAIEELRDLCLQESMALQVIMIPDLHQLVPYPFSAEYAKVSAVLSSLNIEHLDLTPYFADQEEPHELWVALDDAHPNRVAHRMIAQYSFDFINDFAKVDAPDIVEMSEEPAK